MNVDRVDTDGDGVSDLEEIAAGSNPIDGSVSNRVLLASILAVTPNTRPTPNMFGSPALPGVEFVPNGQRMALSWNVYGNLRHVPVTFYVEITTDLVNWIEVPGGRHVADGINNLAVTFSYPMVKGVLQHRLRVAIE